MTAPLSSRSTDRFAEFVEGKTAEARFVRACDKLQLMLKVWHYESQGATGLKGFWQNEENFVANGFAEIEL